MSRMWSAVEYAVSVKRHCRKLVSIIRRDFNSSKCKTWARMTTARIKLLRNKRESVVRQMRRDVALLLQSNQEQTARIRVEHVIREQNMMAANEILELFCERIVTRLSIISKQKECPTDLKEAISSLIFAAPRCSDIPELISIRDIFRKKYGQDFVSAATDLRPDSGVNRMLIEKLSALNPPGVLKLKVMKEIAKEYQLDWDITDTEAELLNPVDDRIEGPRVFVSASILPLNAELKPLSRSSGDANYQDAASAARAAADCAKNAVAAANAAAQLANASNLDNHHTTSTMSPHSFNHHHHHHNQGSKSHRSQSFGAPYDSSDDNATSVDLDDADLHSRRHSYNVRRVHTDIKFDDSDSDEDPSKDHTPGGMYQAFRRTSSNATTGVSPSVHPKLPDYDAITARFEDLKYRKT